MVADSLLYALYLDRFHDRLRIEEENGGNKLLGHVLPTILT